MTPVSPQRALLLAAKATVSALLLVWLVRSVGWEAVRAELASADRRMLAAYVAVSLAATLVSAIKWRSLARALGLTEHVGRTLVLYLVGYFFNNVLPSSLGGDVVRAYELGRRHEDRFADATASVFVERYTGFCVLLVWSAAAAIVRPGLLADVRILAGVAVVVGAFVVGTWAVFHRPALESVRRRFRLPAIAGLLTAAATLQDAVHRYQERPRALAAALAWSALFYMTTVGTVLVGCLAFGAQPAVGDLIVAVPVILMLFAVPISIGGIGLQEWALFAVLTRIGVPAAAALSFGVIFRLRNIGFGLVGGLLYPLTGMARGSPRGAVSAPPAVPPPTAPGP